VTSLLRSTQRLPRREPSNVRAIPTEIASLHIAIVNRRAAFGLTALRHDPRFRARPRTRPDARSPPVRHPRTQISVCAKFIGDDHRLLSDQSIPATTDPPSAVGTIPVRREPSLRRISREAIELSVGRVGHGAIQGDDGGGEDSDAVTASSAATDLAGRHKMSAAPAAPRSRK
jgi:hypothetical protein